MIIDASNALQRYSIELSNLHWEEEKDAVRVRSTQPNFQEEEAINKYSSKRRSNPAADSEVAP